MKGEGNKPQNTVANGWVFASAKPKPRLSHFPVLVHRRYQADPTRRAGEMDEEPRSTEPTDQRARPRRARAPGDAPLLH